MVTSAQQPVMWHTVFTPAAITPIASMPRKEEKPEVDNSSEVIDSPSQTSDLSTRININTHRESQTLETRQLRNRDITIPIHAPVLHNQASITSRIYRGCVRAAVHVVLDTRRRQFICCTATAFWFLLGGAVGSVVLRLISNPCNAYETIN